VADFGGLDFAFANAGVGGGLAAFLDKRKPSWCS